MIILLFGILWGGLLALLLCAPYSYYPLFLVIFLISFGVYFVSRKFFNPCKKIFIAAFLILLVASYSFCSYIIFKPSDVHFTDTKNLSKDKRAVIFYCEGEMEKYTPYYANYFLREKPLLLKPFYSVKIKHIYRQLGINAKNKDLLNVAMEVKNSLLNYKPYCFYIAFSGYFPNIETAIKQAITDGCSEITIINYTPNRNLDKELSKYIKIDTLTSLGVKIKFTKSIYESNSLVDLFTQRITNMPYKWDGIIILDNDTNTALSLKNSLIKYGYRDDQIVISTKIEDSINTFKKNNSKSILYVSLTETSSGLSSEYKIPMEFNKYSSDLKITGIKSWGYDKILVKSVIDSILECEKSSF